MTVLRMRFLWIPRELGGHRSNPWVGMRPTIRWQELTREWLERAIDGECVDLWFDHSRHIGEAALRLRVADLPEERFAEGTRIELLDGTRVIAVGLIAAGNE